MLQEFQCPSCRAYECYNLHGDDFYCNECGYDRVEAHEEEKRHRLAEREEY